MDRYRHTDESSDTPAEWSEGVERATGRAIQVSLLDAVADYVELPQVTALKGDGATTVRSWFDHLSKHLDGPKLHDVTPKAAYGYIQSLADNGLSKGSVSNRLSKFRSAWRYWVEMELVGINPWLAMKPSDFRFKSATDRQAFTPAQYQLLMGACNGTDKQLQMDVMLLTVTTGLKMLQLMSLRTVDVEAVQYGGATRYILKLSGEVTETSVNALRSVPVPAIATATLERLLNTSQDKGHQYLLGYNGEPRKKGRAIAQALADRLKTLPGDWKGITPLHSLRRSYVQTLMKSEADTPAATVIMGHATGDLTFGLDGRGAVSTDQLFEAIDKAYWGVWAVPNHQ